jgi:hypothetical protein
MNPTNEQSITIIIRTLAAMAALCVLTICCLSAMSFAIPEILSNLTSSLIGALTAMLVKTTPTPPAAIP